MWKNIMHFKNKKLYANPVPSINRNVYNGQTTKIYELSYNSNTLMKFVH